MSAFVDSLDIANRALVHLGLSMILDVDEPSQRNAVISAAYDKLREAELERNVWKFAKRKVYLRPISATSRLLSPAQWNENETYLPGAIVADANNDLWISWDADNYGNEPGVTDAWDSYFGPMAIDQWSSGVTYFPGELVWKQTSINGGFAVFLNSKVGNQDTPDLATAWDATALYGLNDRVLSAGYVWRSLITVNLNVTPAVAPDNWSEGVTYATSATVVASDGFIYTALPGAPAGLDPLDDDGTFWLRGLPNAWSRDPVQYTAAGSWLPIFANAVNMPGDWLYVSSGGPNGINVFRYPSGVMRMARPGYRFRNAPNDIEPHGDYLTSADAQLALEFVANIRNVRKMDAMFCEGLAVRIAMSTCKELTGSTSDISVLASEYNKFMNEARTINGIEMGPEEPDEDEYITARNSASFGGGGFSSASTNWWGG